MLEIINTKILDHPNIIKIEKWKVFKNNLYIFMEFADGGDLKNFIRKVGQ